MQSALQQKDDHNESLSLQYFSRLPLAIVSISCAQAIDKSAQPSCSQRCRLRQRAHSSLVKQSARCCAFLRLSDFFMGNIRDRVSRLPKHMSGQIATTRSPKLPTQARVTWMLVGPKQTKPNSKRGQGRENKGVHRDEPGLHRSLQTRLAHGFH